MKRCSVGIAVLVLSGCKALVPYDSKFMCESSQDFGRCMSVSEAYQESLNGPTATETDKYPDAWQYKQNGKEKRGKATKGRGKRDEAKYRNLTASLSGRDLYKENEYRELAALIEAPTTPLVRPPKALRTLIVTYPAGETLYMPRYIVYFAEEARFVVGDYLNEQKAQAATIFPNGKR